jgi:hypothetical protein
MTYAQTLKVAPNVLKRMYDIGNSTNVSWRPNRGDSLLHPRRWRLFLDLTKLLETRIASC